MSSTVLSKEEKREMLTDANSTIRKEAFYKARISSLDDYIEFLSKNMEAVPNLPVRRITDDFRL